MLLSMTGFGDARSQTEQLSVAVEIRTVNNRYLKVAMKYPDPFAPFEGEIEKLMREVIARGTVNVNIRLERRQRAEDFRLNLPAVEAYWQQLRVAAETLQARLPGDLSSLLVLPGVVDESSSRTADVETGWPLIRGALQEALQKLQGFRAEEGRSMERELLANIEVIARRVQDVAMLAPQVVSEYRNRLLERVRQVLQETNVPLETDHLIREVSIFADKADINEELTRLRCHLDQFQAFVKETASAGRKLDFLTQEIFREVNTIGSKANNVPIAHAVVEMKGAVEKIREILQNVE